MDRKDTFSLEEARSCPKHQSAIRGRNLASYNEVTFPEALFPPSDERRDRYSTDVATGYDVLRNQRVVLAGLARDVADVLPLTIQRIERQGAMFGDYRVVIFENDSSDATPQILADWAQNNCRVHVISQRRHDPVNEPTRCLDRASRMAYYRSRCQQVIAEQFSSFDHVMIVDTDLFGGWSYDGIAHTFAQGDWDFVGANGLIYRRQWFSPNHVVQYDAWAYRDDEMFTPLTTKHVNHLALSPRRTAVPGVFLLWRRWHLPDDRVFGRQVRRL